MMFNEMIIIFVYFRTREGVASATNKRQYLLRPPSFPASVGGCGHVDYDDYDDYEGGGR